MQKEEIYNQVTEQIISDLQNGHIPWERPWNGGFMLPRNAHTSSFYNGINILILWMKQKRSGFKSSQWLTFKQAQELGGNIRKGEKGTHIIFYRSLDVNKTNEQGDTEQQTIPMLKIHSVFNLTQTEGLEELINSEFSSTINENELCYSEKAEAIISASQAKISFDGLHEAFYSVKNDSIHLPEKNSFKDQIGYYGTILHELTHWTGAKHRLNRNLEENGRAHYANEELVAELGSSFLCAHSGLEYTSQHAAYIESWLKIIREDSSAIFKAASKARIATEFLLSPSQVSLQ